MAAKLSFNPVQAKPASKSGCPSTKTNLPPLRKNAKPEIAKHALEAEQLLRTASKLGTPTRTCVSPSRGLPSRTTPTNQSHYAATWPESLRARTTRRGERANAANARIAGWRLARAAAVDDTAATSVRSEPIPRPDAIPAWVLKTTAYGKRPPDRAPSFAR